MVYANKQVHLECMKMDQQLMDEAQLSKMKPVAGLANGEL